MIENTVTGKGRFIRIVDPSKAVRPIALEWWPEQSNLIWIDHSGNGILLSRPLVADLWPILKAFAETGQLPEPEPPVPPTLS